jgi:hypothetical protein
VWHLQCWSVGVGGRAFAVCASSSLQLSLSFVHRHLWQALNTDSPQGVSGDPTLEPGSSGGPPSLRARHGREEDQPSSPGLVDGSGRSSHSSGRKAIKRRGFNETAPFNRQRDDLRRNDFRPSPGHAGDNVAPAVRQTDILQPAEGAPARRRGGLGRGSGGPQGARPRPGRTDAPERGRAYGTDGQTHQSAASSSGNGLDATASSGRGADGAAMVRQGRQPRRSNVTIGDEYRTYGAASVGVDARGSKPLDGKTWSDSESRSLRTGRLDGGGSFRFGCPFTNEINRTRLYICCPT